MYLKELKEDIRGTVLSLLGTYQENLYPTIGRPAQTLTQCFEQLYLPEKNEKRCLTHLCGFFSSRASF